MNRALIFDVDGTLADTESMHLQAFNAAFMQCGLDWHWSQAKYRELLGVSGGKERLLHYWKMVDPLAASSSNADATVRAVHAHKTKCYAALVDGGKLALRPGVLHLMHAALERGCKLALVTTTTPDNIDALLRTPMGTHWREYFTVIEDASTAARKKPDPQAYAQALQRLQLSAAQCLAFEDSANGLTAAHALGITTIVTPTLYTHGQDFSAAARVLDDLQEFVPLLDAWLHGHAL